MLAAFMMSMEYITPLCSGSAEPPPADTDIFVIGAEGGGIIGGEGDDTELEVE
jgi:hypothetical protein